MRIFLRGLFVAVMRTIHSNKLYLCNTDFTACFFLTFSPSRTAAGTPRSPYTTFVRASPLVIQQPPRRTIHASLPRTVVALSRPSLRRCPSPRVTTSSSSSRRPGSGALHHQSTV